MTRSSWSGWKSTICCSAWSCTFLSMGPCVVVRGCALAVDHFIALAALWWVPICPHDRIFCPYKQMADQWNREEVVFRNVCSETRQRQRQDLWWGRSSFWMKRNVSCFGKKPSLDEIKCLRWDARPAVGGGWFELFCTIMGNKEATAMHSRRAPAERWQNQLDL